MIVNLWSATLQAFGIIGSGSTEFLDVSFVSLLLIHVGHGRTNCLLYRELAKTER